MHKTTFYMYVKNNCYIAKFMKPSVFSQFLNTGYIYM